MQLNKRIPGLPDWPAIHQHGNEYVVSGEHIPYGPFAVFSAFSFLPAKLICRIFFKTTAVVRFTASRVIIGNEQYALDNGVPVQFRANRPHMKEESYKARAEHIAHGRLGEHTGWVLKFRRVEMIYGAKVVHIASIENPDRAEQYVLGLQVAHDLALSGKVHAAPTADGRARSKDDTLPE